MNEMFVCAVYMGALRLVERAAHQQIAAGVLYPWFGLLLSPIIAGVAMAFSSVAVIGNSLRLRRVRLARA